MKKTKLAILVIISVLSISVLLYFIPLNQLLGKIPLLNTFYNNTSLEIIVQKGQAKVWINGSEYGETPVTVENLPEGDYTVELEKIAEETTFYKKHSLRVELIRNATTRIELEIGPDELLHGSVLHYTSIKTTSNSGFLTVTSDLEKSKIFINNEYIKDSTITNYPLEENEYEVKVSATGYEDVVIPLVIKNNYVLNLKTYHFPIPLNLDIVEQLNNE